MEHEPEYAAPAMMTATTGWPSDERTECIRWNIAGHVARLVDMERRFQAGWCATRDEIATRYGVKPDTITKDLLILQGEPLYLPLVREGGANDPDSIWHLIDVACDAVAWYNDSRRA